MPPPYVTRSLQSIALQSSRENYTHTHSHTRRSPTLQNVIQIELLKANLSGSLADAAEFFAVVTECFFERPRPLRAQHPELYDRLRDFYRRDPAAIEEGRPEEFSSDAPRP